MITEIYQLAQLDGIFVKIQERDFVISASIAWEAMYTRLKIGYVTLILLLCIYYAYMQIDL